MMPTTDPLSALSSVVIAAAAIVTARTAINGLNTWRHQLAGKVEYELAKQHLTGVYRYRDAVRMARIEYFQSSPQYTANMNSDERDKAEHEARVKTFRERQNVISKEKELLYPLVVEAEALWESALSDCLLNMYKIVARYHSQVRRYLWSKNPNNKIEVQRMFERHGEPHYDESVLYETDENTDPYWIEFINSINPIKDYLQDKLREFSPKQSGSLG
ncbi:MAG: hypothetical protein K8F30_01905 [Taibaiella sp.]|nr:hypothetical protein [Taibaiella sp.]